MVCWYPSAREERGRSPAGSPAAAQRHHSRGELCVSSAAALSSLHIRNQQVPELASCLAWDFFCLCLEDCSSLFGGLRSLLFSRNKSGTYLHYWRWEKGCVVILSKAPFGAEMSSLPSFLHCLQEMGVMISLSSSLW